MPKSAFDELQSAPEEELSDFLGGFFANPYGFIKVAFPWKEPGTMLELFSGPEPWVEGVCEEVAAKVFGNAFNGKDPVPTTFVAIASGNGCAKSAFTAMMADWILCTRPFCQGTVTANTGTQLRDKTWQEIEKWTGMCIASHWFDVSSEHVRHKVHGSKWALNATTWSLKNTQAFAGQHAKQSSSFYFFDEASHIPDEIHKQADGGLTDGEPFYFLTGNPGNRVGMLHNACFGPLAKKYIHRNIDSRTCEYTNKKTIEEWGEERGEDSDWFRVHVKGLPPAADDLQFIDTARVAEARRRPVYHVDKASEPLIMAIDFARGGKAWNYVAYRRGLDMRSVPFVKIPGEDTRDTTLMVSVIIEEIRNNKPDMVVGDATGIGGPIMDQLRRLNTINKIPMLDFSFAGKVLDRRYANAGSKAYSDMKEWLKTGAVYDEDDLEVQLTNREFYHIKDRLMLETKEQMEARGVPSPDFADACVMTFDMRQPPPKQKAAATPPPQRASTTGRGWMRA